MYASKTQPQQMYKNLLFSCISKGFAFYLRILDQTKSGPEENCKDLIYIRVLIVSMYFLLEGKSFLSNRESRSSSMGRSELAVLSFEDELASPKSFWRYRLQIANQYFMSTRKHFHVCPWIMPPPCRVLLPISQMQRNPQLSCPRGKRQLNEEHHT